MLLSKTIFRHKHCFLSSVATDGKDGRGLKLEKNFANQARCNALPAKLPRKLLWSVLLYRSILCLGRGTKGGTGGHFRDDVFLDQN